MATRKTPPPPKNLREIEPIPLSLRGLPSAEVSLGEANKANAAVIELPKGDQSATDPQPIERQAYPKAAPSPEPVPEAGQLEHAGDKPVEPIEPNEIEIVDAPTGAVHRNLYARIDTLQPHPLNYNEHPMEQIAKLQESLKQFGQTRSIVVWRGYILAGEGLWLAAKALGHDRIRIDEIDASLTELQAQSYIAADNELARQSRPDEVQLYTLVMQARQASAELALAVGFTDDDIAQLARRMQQKAAPQETTDAPPQFERAKELALVYETEVGQVWQLGRHRLAIGDCRDPQLVERLTEGQPIDSMITDPPYGVDYGDKSRHLAEFRKGPTYQDIEGDQAADIANYRLFFAEFLRAAPMAYHNTAYIFMAGQRLHELRLALDDAGYKWGDYLIWVKHAPVITRKDYHAQHEFIAYGWKDRHRFYGGYPQTIIDDQIALEDLSKADAIETLKAIYSGSNIIRVDRPMRHARHPTEKPVELYERLAFDGSAQDSRIFDPFVGSGTIYIAAERRKRKAYGIELRPEYAAVTIERYKESTGIEPARIVE